MKKFLLFLLFPMLGLAQQIPPHQISPGTNGQILQTIGGVTAWGSGCGSFCVLTNPTATQTIAQPAGTSLNLLGGPLDIGTSPTYAVNIGALGTMAASWNFDTTTQATALASLNGLPLSGGTLTGPLTLPTLTATTSVTTPTVNATTYLVPGLELGAQITAAVAAGYTNIKLLPNANYSMTTVATAGIGVLIDCQGSTIVASYSLGDLIEWNNDAAWTNIQSEFVHPPTGIENCKFLPSATPTGNTTMRIGYVGAISNFVADNITVDYGGGFEVNGPSILGTYKNVHIVNPTTPSAWLFELGTGASGWFGPNASQIIAPYCEGVSGPLYSGQNETCFEVDSGSVNIIGGYMEAFGTGVHVNGGGVSLGGGTAIGVRGFPSTIVQFDSGSLSVNGIEITFGDSASNSDVGFALNNSLSTYPTVNVANVTVTNIASSTSSATLFNAAEPTVLNLSNLQYTGNGSQLVIFGITGSGSYQLSTITNNSFWPSAGTTNLFTNETTGSVFSGGSITGNAFNRVTSIYGLNGTSYVGNSHVGVTPTIIFTGAGTFTGNTCNSGATVTLDGSYATSNLGCATSDVVGTLTATTSVTAGTTTPTTIGSNGVLLNGVPALQAQTSLNNYYSGGSGNLTGTGTYNTANGWQALYFNTTGYQNTAIGVNALRANTTGYQNTANGLQALYSNTTGYQNTAIGWSAGQYIADGVTANQTSGNSVYVGAQAYPLASGDTNENVIGNGAIGHGSNTTTLGNTSITDTYLQGNVHATTSVTTPTLTATTSVTTPTLTATTSVTTPVAIISGNIWLQNAGISEVNISSSGPNALYFTGNGGVVNSTFNGNVTSNAGLYSATVAATAGITAGTTLAAKVYTVATLPTGLPAGTQAVVSDATTFTPGACAGGGSDTVIAVYSGAAWNCM